MVQHNPDYDYSPSFAAAATFGALFALVMIGHILLAVQKRVTWMWPLIFGIAMEVVGYATRYVAAKNIFTRDPYIVSQVMLVVAPAFMCAQIYMIIGRAMAYVGSEHSIIHHAVITKIFVTCDVVAIFSQAAGASTLASTNINVLRAGFHFLVAALAFQVVTFGFFLFVGIVFDVRSRKGLGDLRRPLRPLFIVFYLSAFLILGRSIYRTVEFSDVKFGAVQATGYLLLHEWPFYVLDSVPIFLAVVLWLVVHPARYLPREKGIRLDGTQEAQRPGCCGRNKVPKRDGSSSNSSTVQDNQPVAMQHLGGRTV